MNAHNSDYETDDVPSDLLKGLEQLAQAIDAQYYPRPAWSPAPVPRARPRGRPRGRQLAAALTLVAGIAASACAAIIVFSLHHAPAPPAAMPAAVAVDIPPAPGNPSPHAETVAVDNEVAAWNGPQVVVVEDLDSYSLIDLSASSPIVSYTSKDASCMDFPVPVPLGLQSPPAALDPML